MVIQMFLKTFLFNKIKQCSNLLNYARTPTWNRFIGPIFQDDMRILKSHVYGGKKKFKNERMEASTPDRLTAREFETLLLDLHP